MKKITVTVEDFVYEFYKKIGEQAGGISVEQVIADSLFKFAGTLSLDLIRKKANNSSK